MTDSGKGYKFKIEIQTIFANEKLELPTPDIKCSVYGNSLDEVMTNLNELINGLIKQRWHKK